MNFNQNSWLDINAAAFASVALYLSDCVCVCNVICVTVGWYCWCHSHKCITLNQVRQWLAFDEPKPSDIYIFSFLYLSFSQQLHGNIIWQVSLFHVHAIILNGWMGCYKCLYVWWMDPMMEPKWDGMSQPITQKCKVNSINMKIVWNQFIMCTVKWRLNILNVYSVWCCSYTIWCWSCFVCYICNHLLFI